MVFLKSLREPQNGKEEVLITDFIKACSNAKKIRMDQLRELVSISLGVKGSDTISNYIKRLEQMGFIEHEYGMIWLVHI